MSRDKDNIIDNYFNYHINTRTKTLYLGSQHDNELEEAGVDYLMAERAIKGLDVLDSLHSDKPLIIKMNNPGGDETHGMAVYDAIRECQSEVQIKVYGYAESMGSIILQAADIRVMHPHASLMLHYGDGGSVEHQKNVERYAEQMKAYNTWMEDLFLSVMKPTKQSLVRKLQGREEPKGQARNKLITWTRDELQAMINFDTYINAQEALELGFIDKVIESTDRLIKE